MTLPPLAERLDILRGWYETTSNPLYAWEAFAECLAADIPIPAWAKPYFSRVAGSLADRSRVPAKDPGAPAKFVLHALELNVKGGPGPFRERLLWQRQNEARIRAALTVMNDSSAATLNPQALQQRYESELQAAGHDPDSLRKRTTRAFKGRGQNKG